MIDYQLDIKPLEDEGMTDEQISQHLASRTLRPLPCSSARMILQETGALAVDPVMNARAGLLIDHYKEMEDTPNKKLLAWFINHVMGEGVDVSTNEYPRSVQWASVTASMSAELQDVVALLIASAGGQPDADVTVDDVVAAREEYNAMVANDLLDQQKRKEMQEKHQKWVTLYNQNIAPLLDSDTEEAAWKEAIQKMADEWSS